MSSTIFVLLSFDVELIHSTQDPRGEEKILRNIFCQ